MGAMIADAHQIGRASPTHARSHIVRHPLNHNTHSQVPFANVVTLKTLDKSSTLNTESHGYYACTAADSNAVGKALTNCNDSGRR
jgi:hypothetical protein